MILPISSAQKENHRKDVRDVPRFRDIQNCVKKEKEKLV